MNISSDIFNTTQNPHQEYGNKVCSVNFLDSSNEERPAVWLTSFPRSGNTWTRHLLELATGIYTGSSYHANGLYNAGFKGEFDSPQLGRELIYKCHRFTNSMKFGILLIRNPYDSLISFYQYRTIRHLTLESYRNNLDWINWAKRKHEKWLNLVEDWFKSGKLFLVVHYEDIVKNPLEEVERMLNFLNITFTPERRNCVQNDIEGAFHKQHKEQFRFDPFTKELHRLINTDIQIVNRLLQSRNETPIPEPTYDNELRKINLQKSKRNLKN
ncbi:sialate:O-sulfotransferase 1-like [Saccoglossus kowalevskii]|uniref:WSC domain-containing protein 1-like n=1 Tax=Saccoglossus kowalevskii TaxID=10224 RepID=A0ABM0MFK6_SACKO|nr:PREDICTED: WSC domain-containing protein 1-like [Saccoglossus kowalevskii]